MESPSKTNRIGEKIRELRKQRRLTQRELANLVGCANNTVTEWEKRRGRAPGKKVIGKVAQALGVSVDYLLGAESTRIPKIPCYGEVSSNGFYWDGKREADYFIEIIQGEYAEDRFCFKIVDDLLEPIVNQEDYAIFDRTHPEDGDIAIVRCNPGQKCVIKRWRQKNNSVMLSEVNPYKLADPFFLEISEKREILRQREDGAEFFHVEGRLTAVKRVLKLVKTSKIHYVLS